MFHPTYLTRWCTFHLERQKSVALIVTLPDQLPPKCLPSKRSLGTPDDKRRHRKPTHANTWSELPLNARQCVEQWDDRKVLFSNTIGPPKKERQFLFPIIPDKHKKKRNRWRVLLWASHDSEKQLSFIIIRFAMIWGKRTSIYFPIIHFFIVCTLQNMTLASRESKTIRIQLNGRKVSCVCVCVHVCECVYLSEAIRNKYGGFPFSEPVMFKKDIFKSCR